MDEIVGLLALSTVLLSSFVVARRLLHGEDIATVAISGFVFGIASILLPLYYVGIVLGFGFIATSWVILLVSIGVLAVTGTKRIGEIRQYPKRLAEIVMQTTHSPLGFFFIAVIVSFLIKYVYFLSVKGIIDYDAVSTYLPFAQSIFRADRIPLVGFDFEPIIRPAAIVVLYAWSYSLGGSIFDQSFRLFPVLFQVMTIAIIYYLGKRVYSTETGIIAAIIYMLLPLQDSALFYATYYPDLLYNALVLAAFFFILKYHNHRVPSYLLLCALSFGLALLLKLQTAYFLPAIVLVFIAQLRGSQVRIASTYLAIILVGFLFVFLAWPSPATFLDFPLVGKGTFLAVLILAATVGVLLSRSLIGSNAYPGRNIRETITDLIILGFGVLVVGSIWFLRNYFLTGSFVWYVNIQNPALEWALSVLASLTPSIVPHTIGQYLALLVLAPPTVYVLGVWAVPTAIGVATTVKTHSMGIIIVLWSIGYYVGYFLSTLSGFQGYALNERDFYVLAPFISILGAVGLLAMSRRLKGTDLSAVPFVVCTLGLASLTQSLLVWEYGPDVLRSALNGVLALFGTSMDYMTWRHPMDLMLVSLPQMLIFSIVIGFLGVGILAWSRATARSGRGFRVRKLALTGLVLLILIVPNLSMTYQYSGGNIGSFGESQLNNEYQGYYSEVLPYLDNVTHTGDVILKFDGIPLQYYLHSGATVIDLSIEGNLAAYRSAIENKTSSATIDILQAKGVGYVILERSPNSFVSGLVNRTVPELRNPEYFELVHHFTSWDVYRLVGTSVTFVKGWQDNTFVKNWTYFSKYSTPGANYTFSSHNGVLTIQVGGNSTISFQYLGIPPLNSSTYSVVYCRVSGTTNARWLFRLFSQDGKASFDFPYWGRPTESFQSYVFTTSGTPLTGKILDREAILQVMSVDLLPATINIEFYIVGGYFGAP